MGRFRRRRFGLTAGLAACLVLLGLPALSADPQPPMPAAQGVRIEVELGIKGVYKTGRVKPAWFPVTIKAQGLRPGAAGTARATLLSCSAG